MTIAIITGGSRGLGKSMALNLAAKGADVIITYHSKKREAEDVVTSIEKSGRKAVALQLDTSDTKSFPAFATTIKETLKQTWKRDNFDFLVNNAGTSLHVSIAETTEEQFDQVVNTNFKGVFFLTQALLPLIADGGRIINISSGLARFSAPGSSVYGSLKGAIDVLTRYMALELGSRHIAVNAVAPGAIATDFSGGMVRDNPQMN